MKTIEILSDVQVSPDWAERGAALVCSYPKSAILGDGRMACAYRVGTAKHSRDGRFVSQVSCDGGGSWSEPITLFDGTGESPSRTALNVGICAVGANHLVAMFGAVVGLAPDEYMFSDEGKSIDRRLHLTGSDDAGRNWSEPVEVSRGRIPARAARRGRRRFRTGLS